MLSKISPPLFVVGAALRVNDYRNGVDNQTGVKTAIDITFSAIGFLGPVGLMVSVSYFCS